MMIFYHDFDNSIISNRLYTVEFMLATGSERYYFRFTRSDCKQQKDDLIKGWNS